jgi:hypothetical protein
MAGLLEDRTDVLWDGSTLSLQSYHRNSMAAVVVPRGARGPIAGCMVSVPASEVSNQDRKLLNDLWQPGDLEELAALLRLVTEVS